MFSWCSEGEDDTRQTTITFDFFRFSSTPSGIFNPLLIWAFVQLPKVSEKLLERVKRNGSEPNSRVVKKSETRTELVRSVTLLIIFYFSSLSLARSVAQADRYRENGALRPSGNYHFRRATLPAMRRISTTGTATFYPGHRLTRCAPALPLRPTLHRQRIKRGEPARPDASRRSGSSGVQCLPCSFISDYHL